MAQRKPLFVLTEHCKSKLHCNTCRTRNGGRYWRSTLQSHYSLPNNIVDFDCPYGKTWIEDKVSNINSQVQSVNVQTEIKIESEVKNTTVKPLQRGERLAPVNEQNSQRRGCGCQRNG